MSWPARPSEIAFVPYDTFWHAATILLFSPFCFLSVCLSAFSDFVFFCLWPKILSTIKIFWLESNTIFFACNFWTTKNVELEPTWMSTNRTVNYCTSGDKVFSPFPNKQQFDSSNVFFRNTRQHNFLIHKSYKEKFHILPQMFSGGSYLPNIFCTLPTILQDLHNNTTIQQYNNTYKKKTPLNI